MIMEHTHEHPLHTDGRVIRWANMYDLLLKTVTLGGEGRFRRRMIAAAQLQPGERVLDVGCGTGTLLLEAAAAVGPAGKAFGIDPAAEMIARARRKASRAGRNLELTVAAIEELPLATASVDVVLSSLMFHHLPSNLQRAGLGEIRRVLAPGGRLAIFDFGSDGVARHLVAEAEAAGFDDVTTERFRPRVMFSLVARLRAGEHP
jgi:ubiquinone/menaquinone biosynthesis C-methylase UbiE